MFNFALVGCGGMANWHAQQMVKIPDIKMVALCDTVPGATKAFKDKYFNDAAEFDSYEKLLEKPPAKLDAVLLVTPHTLHYQQSKAALERGINVMVEKPMVTSSAHAYDLWDTVKKTKKLLGITFQAPYSQEFGYLAKERDAGRLALRHQAFGMEVGDPVDELLAQQNVQRSNPVEEVRGAAGEQDRVGSLEVPPNAPDQSGVDLRSPK